MVSRVCEKMGKYGENIFPRCHTPAKISFSRRFKPFAFINLRWSRIIPLPSTPHLSTQICPGSGYCVAHNIRSCRKRKHLNGERGKTSFGNEVKPQWRTRFYHNRIMNKRLQYYIISLYFLSERGNTSFGRVKKVEKCGPEPYFLFKNPKKQPVMWSSYNLWSRIISCIST